MNAYLIKKTIRKLLETLGAHKALFVIQLSITVDNFLCCGETTFASLTDGTGQGIGNAVE